MTRLVAIALLGVLSLPAVAQSDDPAWSWSPEPRWLGGVGFSGFPSFEGGLAYGDESTIGAFPVSAEATIPVDIVFDKTMTTSARVFDRSGYVNAGVGVFNGAAYDVSDPSSPRQLNVVVLESDSDLAWSPPSASVSREYLFILTSDYDGDGSSTANTDYSDLEVAYVLLSGIRDGRTIYESNPATLAIRPPALRHVTAFTAKTGTLWAEWTPYASNGAATVRVYLDDGTGEQLAGTTSADARWFAVDGLDAAAEYAVRVEALDGSGAVLGDVTVRERPALPDGIEAVARFDPRRSSFSTYGDVWGYTAPDGTEYALLTALATGLSVIDITDAPAAPPVEVGFIPLIDGAQESKDVKVYGHHAYVVHERGPTQIIDLSDPGAPVQVGTLDPQPGTAIGGAHNVAVFDGHLWFTGGRSSGGNAGVRVYDVRTTPEAPVFVGEFRPEHSVNPYYHDFEVRDGIGYGPNINSGNVDVLDVSDPSNIRLISTFTYPNGGGPHNTCTSTDGSTLYVGNEVRGDNWTRIFDVSDPQNVELVGEIIVDREAVVHNCYVRDDILYIAHYTEGLQMYNVQQPQRPFKVASYDTYREPGYGFNGAWTAYPYFASGKVIVSDLQSGLFVVQPSAAAVTQEAAPESDAARLTVAPNPVRGVATVAFALDAPAAVRVSVVDVQGREVSVLHEDRAMEGEVAVSTEALPAGVYLVRLSADGRTVGSRLLTVVR